MNVKSIFATISDVLGGIAGTGTAVSAIKNKSIGDSK